MSLLEFPPLGDGEFSHALHETNGRIAYGTSEDVDMVAGSDLLYEYSKINKRQLQLMQHSMSRENVRRVFSENQSNCLQQAVDVWQKEGTRGLMELMVNASEGSRFGWYLSNAGKLLRKADEDIRSALSISDEDLISRIDDSSSNINWRTNWIRCLAFHGDGHRLAVCQLSDHIRIFSFGTANRSPVTLKHNRQQNVTEMAWKPFDAMVLAVACQDAVLVWRLNPKTLTNRPSAQCAQVLELGYGYSPVTQCIWDHSLSSALFVVSPSSTRLLIMDTATGESETIGGWTGARIHRVWSSPDHSKLLVSYSSDTIKVYDRNCWRAETWSGLAGGCVAAVWSPDSNYLLFASRDEPALYSVRFASNIEINTDGQQVVRSYGAEMPIEAYNVCEVNTERGDGQTLKIGGCVHNMELSPDGKRLAVVFKKNPAVIALFTTDWSPSVLLTPCALIEGADFGDASIISFCPNFVKGSLLTVIWSGGRLQYIPLIYGRSAGIYADSAFFVSARDLSIGGNLKQEPQDESNPEIESDSKMHGIRGAKGDAGPDVQLFSTTGLYDQLLSKGMAKNEQ